MKAMLSGAVVGELIVSHSAVLLFGMVVCTVLCIGSYVDGWLQGQGGCNYKRVYRVRSEDATVMAPLIATEITNGVNIVSVNIGRPKRTATGVWEYEVTYFTGPQHG